MRSKTETQRLRIAAGQRGGGCGIRTREGLPPTRFPTLLITIRHGPPPSATWADVFCAVAGEHSRTAVNEAKTETRQVVLLNHHSGPSRSCGFVAGPNGTTSPYDRSAMCHRIRYFSRRERVAVE